MRNNRMPYLLAMLFATFAAAYFIGKYCEIDRDAQSSAKIKIHTKLVGNYLNWRPPKYSADFLNPYHDSIISSGSEIVPVLIQSQNGNKSVSAEVVRALGEIGSPDALDFLLSTYKTDPRPDTAVAIGSCWRASSLGDIFMLDKTARDNLLQSILLEKWDSVKNKNEAEIQKYITDNINSIVENCKQRSKPVLG